jgi:hypothetical protein
MASHPDVVQRFVRCDWSDARARLAGHGFERVDRLDEIWRAVRLLGPHRVELEVSRVAHGAAEVRVLPLVARWPRFGPRRQARYVELARAAADELADQVIAATAAVRTFSEIAAVPPYMKPIEIADFSPVR